MINAAVIGVGYWGPNIIRNFASNPDINLCSCSDLKKERLDLIKRSYPVVNTFIDYKEIIKDNKIDLIAICTPVYSHYEIAKSALESGKHVLIEKPMTSTSAQAEELVNLAEKKGLKIFVDHTFIYTGAVRKIKELVRNGELGSIYYFDSVRVNLGLFQHDVNVIWDLAPHDISIMHYLLEIPPDSVVATGADHIGNGLEDVAYMTIYYPNNMIAHIHSNWLSPTKIRLTLIAGDKRMVVWDDIQPSEKVKIYDKGIEVIKTSEQIYNTLIQYRTGDIYSPKLDSREALVVETQHIVDCLEKKCDPIVDGKAGWMVVRILEAAQQSIKNKGRLLRI